MKTNNFTLEELERSSTAVNHKIKNKVPDRLLSNAQFTLEQMERVRKALNDKPVLISSGYRSEELNVKVGGSRTSAHTKALAVDFVCPGFGSPVEICKAILAAGIEFDQLILEFGRWVHIGWSSRESKDRRQVLTAKKQDAKTVYVPGLIE